MSIQIKDTQAHTYAQDGHVFIIKDQEDLIVYAAVSFFSFIARTKKPSHLQRQYP